MCGRYILRDAAKAEAYFQVHGTPWSPSFNVAPSISVPVVRVREGGRIGELLRWGLVPYFTHGEPPKFTTHNARIETFETAASYRGPWRRGQRCLQVASGFYEWHIEDDGRKFPYFIHLNDQEHFAFASIWDRSFKADGTAIESTSILTLPANELMTFVHNAGDNPHRMPAILRKEDHEAWLHGSIDEARALLQQYPSDHMVAYRISTRVNGAKNDDPSLIEPMNELPPVAEPKPKKRTPRQTDADDDPQGSLL